jgi:hypothetical protein
MITILVGFLVIAAIVSVFHITGKIFVKYLMENNNEDIYIGHGFAIWVILLFAGVVFYAIGKTILHFI